MIDITYLSDKDIEKLDLLFQFLKVKRQNNVLGYFSLDRILEQELNEPDPINQRDIVQLLSESGLTNICNINGDEHIWTQQCNLKGATFDSFKNEKIRQEMGNKSEKNIIIDSSTHFHGNIEKSKLAIGEYNNQSSNKLTINPPTSEPKSVLKRIIVPAIVTIICTVIAGYILHKMGWV